MKIVSIVSARPNFVKLAGVHHALKIHAPDWEHILIHTGQHYAPMFSDVFFDQLDISLPHYNLEACGDGREGIIACIRSSLSPLLLRLKPDVVLLYGDVNGTMGAAEASREANMRIAHIEAGLRSFDLTMPEEMNRLAIDAMSDLLFCSEDSAVKNLRNEGIEEGVHLVGNTMIDTLQRMLPMIKSHKNPEDIPELFGVVTLHRPSNVDSREDLLRNLSFLAKVSECIPLVFPMHHRTKAAIDRFGIHSSIPKNVIMVPALGYVPFLSLVSHARFLLTDSGGIQEEATYLKKRCFTLRTNTERPSTIESGSNTLIDLRKEEDRNLVLRYAQNGSPFTVSVPLLWDGRAGERIVNILRTTHA